MEEDLRRSLRADPHANASFNIKVAESLFGQGRPMEAVREAVERAGSTSHGERSSHLRAAGSASADILIGDFPTADARLAALERETGPLSFDSAAFATPARTRIELALEAGDVKKAGLMADELLKKRGGRSDEFDPRPFLYSVAVRAGLRTPAEAKAQLENWLREPPEETSGSWRWVLWTEGYAAPAVTAADAKVAVEARAKYPAFSPYNRMSFQLPEVEEGRVREMSGDVDGAIRLPRFGTRACQALSAPIVGTQGWLHLGHALAAKHDADGACHAYDVVLSRWGAAKPRSVSAEAARAGARALGCPAR
jgi:serine/threonine-protein kinase